MSEISKAVDNGASLVIFPSEKNTESINRLLNSLNSAPAIAVDTTLQKISGIDFDNSFFAGVFKKKEENPVLPAIEKHYRFAENRLQNETRLLWFQNNDPALTSKKQSKGKIYIFSFPLNQSSEAFSRDVLFVPVIYKIVLNSETAQTTSFIVGQNNSFLLENEDNSNLATEIEIVNRKNNERFVPEKMVTANGMMLSFNGQVRNDGHFLIQSDDSISAAVAFNYDRKESDLNYLGIPDLKEKIDALQLKNVAIIENAEENFAAIFDEIQKGKQFWKWFIMMGLLMILTEAAIIRFWRNNPKT